MRRAAGSATAQARELRNELAGVNDPKASNFNSVEMPLPADQGVGSIGQRQGDEVIVTRVVGDDPRRIGGIRNPNRLLLQSGNQLGNLLAGDPVSIGDPGPKESLPDLSYQLRTGDDLKVAVVPAVREMRGGSGAGQCPGDDAIGIDDDLQPPSAVRRPFRRKSGGLWSSLAS